MARSCSDQFSVSHRHLRRRTPSSSHNWPRLSTTHLMIKRAWNKRKCANQVLASRKKPPKARHRLSDRITSSSTRVAFNARSDNHLLSGRQRSPVSRHLHVDRKGCQDRLGRPSRADVWIATPTPKKYTEQTHKRYANVAIVAIGFHHLGHSTPKSALSLLLVATEGSVLVGAQPSGKVLTPTRSNWA